MIPLRDDNPAQTVPFVTRGLIVLNVLAFVYELSLSDGTHEFLRDWGLVPGRLFAALTGETSLPVELLTLVSSLFLHGGWLHLIGNMWYLWIFGDNVEDRLGHARFVAFYLFCGTAAALAQAFVSPSSRVPMVGASGAIAGVMGAYFVMYPHSRIVTLIPFFFRQVVEVPAVFFLGIWFLMQFLSGVGSIAQVEAGTGGVAFWAHVAGFVAGVLGGLALRRPERQRPEWWHDVESR